MMPHAHLHMSVDVVDDIGDREHRRIPTGFSGGSPSSKGWEL